MPSLTSCRDPSSRTAASATPLLVPKALPPSPLRALLSRMETKGMDLDSGLSEWLPLSLVSPWRRGKKVKAGKPSAPTAARTAFPLSVLNSGHHNLSTLTEIQLHMLSKKQQSLRERRRSPGGAPGGGDVGSWILRSQHPVRCSPVLALWPMNPSQASLWVGPSAGGDWQAEFIDSEHPPWLGRAVSFLWNPQGELGCSP